MLTNHLRFYCPTLPISLGQQALLDTAQTLHAHKVLRLKSGHRVELIDGQGNLATAELEDFQGPRGVFRVIDLRHFDRPRPILTVAAPLPKGPRANQMINQLTQVGVDRFIPLQTQRGSVDPGPGKLRRFDRTVVESAKQARRLFLMQVNPPAKIEQVLTGSFDLRLLAQPAAALRELCQEQIRSARSILILIGPEGGFSRAELATLTSANCLEWSLGPHVLRIETAASTAGAIIRYLVP